MPEVLSQVWLKPSELSYLSVPCRSCCVIGEQHVGVHTECSGPKRVCEWRLGVETEEIELYTSKAACNACVHLCATRSKYCDPWRLGRTL